MRDRSFASPVVAAPVRRYAVVVVFREVAFDHENVLAERPRVSVLETLAETPHEAIREALGAFRLINVESCESICLDGGDR